MYIIYTYKRVVCVCWFVGLSAFYRPHDICPLCGAASEWPRAGSAVVASGPARGGKRMHSESTRVSRACRTTSQRKNCCADICCLSKTKPYARACCRVRDWRDFKKKTNMPLPKFSLQFAFSWSVYFSNRTESYSSQIEFAGPMESRRTRRPTFTAEKRLERRREQDRRRHEERRARQRREHTQARRDVECLRCSQARA